MGALDEISQAIGRLEGKVDAAREEHAALRVDVAALRARVEDLDRLRARGWGLLVGLGLASGSVGASLGGAIRRLAGG